LIDRRALLAGLSAALVAPRPASAATVSDAAGMFIYGPAAAPLARRALAVLLYAGPMDLIIYSTVVACIAALDAWARYHQREQSIVQAQLDALRAQLEPHFLFNALNALSELVYRDPAAADGPHLRRRQTCEVTAIEHDPPRRNPSRRRNKPHDR